MNILSFLGEILNKMNYKDGYALLKELPTTLYIVLIYNLWKTIYNCLTYQDTS